jgi:cytochrome c553
MLLGCRVAAPSGPREVAVPCRDRDSAEYEALCARLAEDPDSVDELLPRLDPQLLDNFTLVYETRGPQRDVDPLHPRVILFGGDARLLLAFTGGPDRDVLDVIHYREAARSFELERFVLPAAARRDPELARVAQSNGRPDPVECLGCHGSDPHPIFDSYRLWPGFYGSARDRLYEGSMELTSYRTFLREKAGIYRALHFAPDAEVSPYALDSSGVAADDFAPNMRLGMALAELNRERIARLIEASPMYAMYRDKLLAGLLGCEHLPIREADRARARAAVAAENRQKLDRAHVTDPQARAELQMAELLHIENLAELDYVARVLDAGWSQWSLAGEAGSTGSFDGILSGVVGDRDFYFKEDLLLPLLRSLAATDPQVAPYFAAKPYVLQGRTGSRLDLPRAIAGCELLASRAREIPWPDEPVPVPRAAFQCVRCHEPGAEGPPIPFDSPARMHALLAARPALLTSIAARTSSTTEKPMPPAGKRLSTSDREQLLAYLRATTSSPE